jgi:hypothetical protein
MEMHSPQDCELYQKGLSMATLIDVPEAQGKYWASEREKLQAPAPLFSP